MLAIESKGKQREMKSIEDYIETQRGKKVGRGGHNNTSTVYHLDSLVIYMFE